MFYQAVKEMKNIAYDIYSFDLNPIRYFVRTFIIIINIPVKEPPKWRKEKEQAEDI